MVTKADGARATNDDLIGAELVARTDDGEKSLMRIDAVRPDPMDKTGARLLYTLSTKNLRQSDAMWDRHQACTRMLRGDYCGDGQAHTKNGTMIDLYDTAGIQSSDPDPGMTFEAAWGKDGAVCVSRTRLADVATVAAIETECPQKLVGHTGSARTEDGATSDPRTLLMNKSQPSK